MPNFCTNTLSIQSSNPELIEQDFSFSKFFPIPDGIDNDGTLDWCLENWGTKWDVRDLDVVTDDTDYLSVYFLTPWNSPIKFLEKLVSVYPECKINLYYSESGLDFSGNWTYSDGKINHDMAEFSKYAEDSGDFCSFDEEHEEE